MPMQSLLLRKHHAILVFGLKLNAQFYYSIGHHRILSKSTGYTTCALFRNNYIVVVIFVEDNTVSFSQPSS